MWSRASSFRFSVAAVVALGAGVGVAEPLFLDGFESGDFCGWSQNPPPPLVVEGEGAGQGLNDVLENATAISRCATVEGVIGEVAANAADFDFYAFTLAAPALLRITLAASDGASDYLPYADLAADDVYPPLGITPFTAGPSTTRQIWVPAAGTWYLFVSHAANWDRVDYTPVAAPTAGGAGSTYRLTLDVETLAGSFAVAGLFEDLELPADGTLPVLSFWAGSTDTLDLAEITAERLAPASPLDAKLYVVANPATAPVTIAECDDQFDGGACAGSVLDTVDPRLVSLPLAAVPHAVVVDFFDLYDPLTGDPEMLPATFDLELQFFSFAP